MRWTLRAVRSVLSDEKKLSFAALSQTLPDRLVEQVMPWVGHQPLELLAGVLAPWPEWCSMLSGLPRRQIAMISASVTS